MAKQYRRRTSESATATPSKRAKLVPAEAPGKAFAGKAGEAADASAGKRRGKKRRDEDEGPAAGFISEADVGAKSRAKHMQDREPPAEELASEQALIDGAGRKGKRQTPAPGKDLLASYMEQLSHIPLF